MRQRLNPFRPWLMLATVASILAAIALLVWVGSVGAEEDWRRVLRIQLVDEKRCVLEAFVSVREMPGTAVGGIDGRVRCADGREFDFTRRLSHQPFELSLCQPAVC